MSNKPEIALKAYHVQGDEHGCIQFAAHNVVARRNGANELDSDFDSVTCRRASQFDEFAAAGKVPVRALLDEGWWWGCTNCDATVYGGRGDELIDGEDVYCCEACRDASFASRIMSARHKQAWIDAAHEKWPGCTVTHASEYRGNVDVSFAFPGGESTAQWVGKENWLYVATRDHPAWAAFTGRPVEIIH